MDSQRIFWVKKMNSAFIVPPSAFLGCGQRPHRVPGILSVVYEQIRSGTGNVVHRLRSFNRRFSIQ